MLEEMETEMQSGIWLPDWFTAGAD